MDNNVASMISEAARYIEELGWHLTVVASQGKRAKCPVFVGWPDFRPAPEQVRAIIEHDWDRGIGLNLGGSGVIDLEGDSPEGEAILDDLCHGIEFPCWQSRRSKHRLFQAHPNVSYMRSPELGIEFRTGRHQSVLPPSVINGTAYEWLRSPFGLPLPPLPEKAFEFYDKEKSKLGVVADRSHAPAKKRWPFRDDKDYILRHFDLKAEAANAGLIFALGSSDANGNIPCYVPDVMRGGDPDDSPSGIFNVFNGVLRDFATCRNHPFFKVIAALTGDDWKDIAASYEAKAGSQSGWPHSRRISYPKDAIEEDPKVSLAKARASLAAYYEVQLSRPPKPKTFHLIQGMPGVGKTYTICKILAEKHSKAIILTLENQLAKTHDQLLKDGGGNARRMPVLKDTACPHPKDYEKMSQRGFKPSQSLPCRKCKIGPKNCPYLLGFSDLAAGDQLCAAAIYHTHRDFYLSHGNETRPIVVFDENCFDFILGGVSHDLNQWRDWFDMMSHWDGDAKHIEAFRSLIDWLTGKTAEFAKAVDKDAKPLKFKVVPLPNALRVQGLQRHEALDDWLNHHAHLDKYRHVDNLYDIAMYLLTEPTSYVMLERIPDKEKEIIKVRFRKRNPLPEDREVFLLDATANEELLKAIAPGWDIQRWECPPIEQTGRIVQIMDYDMSRNRIRREIARHKPTNPSWLVQVLDNILQEHGPAAMISFKDMTHAPKPENDIIGLLAHKNLITHSRNFPCRGHTFDDQTLIVLGTPYKDEASVWEMAMAIGGEKLLPSSAYSHQKRLNGDFVSRNMGYVEPHLRPIQEFVVFADIVQAIGRVRPLQNDSLVFVISNANILDWEVEQFMASELFDMRMPLREDVADDLEAYVACLKEVIEVRGRAKNADICDSIGMPERTGRRYWTRLCHELPEGLMLDDDVIRPVGPRREPEFDIFEL